jgi:hypothetical protein
MHIYKYIYLDTYLLEKFHLNEKLVLQHMSVKKKLFN